MRRENGSTRKNLRFDYDAMGNRIAKHIYADNQFTDWEKSTYYVRDASGNVMAVYDREATGQVPPSAFRVSERHIYGSSRIGMDVTTYDFISTTYTATNETTRELGHKQYEISNHLGNVLSVITDQKLPVVEASVVVSYSAVIITATDYSPFGVGLYGRSWSEGYRYGFNGMEGDDELISSASDFGARILNRSLGRWFTTDCHYYNYYSTSPFVFGINNPNAFIDADGYDVVVAFTGGPTGGGKTVEPVNAGSTGDIMVSAQANALAKDVEFSGLIVAPGATAESAVQTAYEFIKANHSTGEKLLIYAYSYGVDPAVDLCERLKSDGIIVDLLITVDGSDGPFQNYTVNTSIPDNVSRNVNWYQTNNSGLSSSSWSTNSTSSGGSDSSSGSSSHSGSLNFPGSSGGPNTAQDAQKTVLDNVDLTSPLVNHANIPTWTRSTNIQLIQSIIGTGVKGNSNPPKALEPLDLNFKPTPAVQDNTAVGSGQGF